MKVLGLDVSTHTGWAYFVDGKLQNFGLLNVEVEDFNIHQGPEKSPKYPLNVYKAAEDMALLIVDKIKELHPDKVVIENTVKGRNRGSQRLLEWIHKALMDHFFELGVDFTYMDPSEWRKVLEMRLSKEDKKNNKTVRQGKKRGIIGKKHLSVRFANEFYDLKLKLKDENQADAICLGTAFLKAKDNHE